MTQVTARGVSGLAIGCDMTDAAALERLVPALRAWNGGALDLLVLNASGGLERDLTAADPSYPMRINRDAQLALVDRVLPLLRPGSTIVLITSHWAHRFGQVEQLPAYDVVAETKHAGEVALRARQDELAARGIRLLVVSGDLIEGTITPRLLERKARGLAGSRRDSTGKLPTIEDMGAAIVDATLDPTLPGGHTVVVGGALESLPRLGE